MKKKKIYIFISLFILIAIFFSQIHYLSKNTVAETILDYNVDTFGNDPNYIVLQELTDILLGKIDNKDDKKITFIFNNDTAPYEEFGIGYLYLRYYVYPMTMYTSYEFYTSLNKKKYVNEQIKNENLDYILLLGKDTELFNKISTKDYTLYKVIDKEKNIIEEVASLDFGLYDIYLNDESQFNSIVSECKKLIKEYWSFPAIGLMKNLAVSLYENNEYDLAIEYSNYYLDTVDFINDELNMNLGDIYTKQGKTEQAIYHYQICQRNQVCDFETAQNKIDELMQKEAD